MTHEENSKREELLAKKICSQKEGEQTIELAEQEIERLGLELELDDTVLQVAEAIYRRSLEKKFIENRSVGIVAAASVYAACRIEKRPRTSEEVSKLAVESQSVVVGTDTILQRTYSEMSSTLDLRTGPLDPKQLVPRLTNKLNLSNTCEMRAKEILEQADGEVLSGKSPDSLAAASVYGASLLVNEKVTQYEVADVAKVNVSTIRNRYIELLEELDLD